MIGAAAAGRMRMQRALPLAFLAPALLLVALVNFFPALYGFATSLFETSYAKRVAFVGLDQYARLVADERALAAIGNALTYVAVSVSLALGIGLGLALLLSRPWPLAGVFRTILLAPWVISQTVTALLWGWMLNPLYGPASYALGQLGLASFDLLGTPATALPTVVAINVWHAFPLPMILSLAALQTIPVELIEAARMDGATRLQVFRHVTLPALKRTLMMAAMSLTIYCFAQVTLIYTLTGGGPLGRTETISVLAFKYAFVDWQLGYAAALGTIIFALNVIFGVAYLRVLRGPQ
jgi:multiple sugar transport system permease protein